MTETIISHYLEDGDRCLGITCDLVWNGQDFELDSIYSSDELFLNGTGDRLTFDEAEGNYYWEEIVND